MSTEFSSRDLRSYLLSESVIRGEPNFYARPVQRGDNGSILDEYHGVCARDVLFYGNQWDIALLLRTFVIQRSGVDIFDKMIESVYQDNGAAITLSVLAEQIIRNIYDIHNGGLLKLTLNP